MFDVKANFRQNTKVFHTALFAKLMKNPWNKFLYVCPDGLICKVSDNVSGHLDNPIRHWIIAKTGLVFAEI